MLPSVLSGSIMKLADHPSERMAERTNLPPEALAKLRALLGKTDSKHIPKGDQHLRMPDGSSAVLKDIGKRHVVATFYSRNMTPPGRDMRMSLSMRNTRPIFDKARQGKHRSTENASSYEHDLRRALSTGDSALVDQKADEFLADAAIHAKNRVLSPLTTLRGAGTKRKTAEKKPYRHRAEVYIHDGKGNVLANKTDSGWQFPAGGIEGKATPEQTAKREVLEEAGYRIANPRSFGAKPAPAKWPEWYRDIARAKGRDNYAGQVTHMLVAELGKKDKRLFNKEGDGLHSLQLVPLRQVIADHETIVRDPKHTHHVFRKATLPGLKKLHKQLSNEKASRV